jgi:hypothetical protein
LRQGKEGAKIRIEGDRGEEYMEEGRAENEFQS